jgi:pimeloyl-ACP methyl ester carboxylesterase
MSNSDLLLDALGDPFAEHFRVVAFDRRGHGYTADTPAAFHYKDMATETTGVLEQVVAVVPTWSGGATAGSSDCSSPCAARSWSIDLL